MNTLEPPKEFNYLRVQPDRKTHSGERLEISLVSQVEYEGPSDPSDEKMVLLVRMMRKVLEKHLRVVVDWQESNGRT